MSRGSDIVRRLTAAPLHLRLLGGLALVLMVSAGQSIFAYRTAIESTLQDKSAARDHEILALIGKTRSDVLRMDADYSRFLLVGNTAFVNSYRLGPQGYAADLAHLTELTSGNALDVARWQDLQARGVAWQRGVVEPTLAGDLDVPTSIASSSLQVQAIDQILGEATTAQLIRQADEAQATAFVEDQLRAVLVWGTLAVVGVGGLVALLFGRALAQALTQVRAGERRYRQMFESHPAIKLLVDPILGSIVDANRAACDFYGYALSDLLQQRIWSLDTLPADVVLKKLASVSMDGRISFVSRHRLASGETRDVDIQASRVDDRGHPRVLVYAIVHDITEGKQAEEALRHQALHDDLTGLPNRSFLQDRLAGAVRNARRGQTPLTLLLVDLDRFKEINDTFGHHFGDLLLQQVAARARDILRASDTVARLGGDEFGILLPLTDADHAVAVAQQLLRTLEAPFVLDGQPVEIGASIGIAGYPADGTDAATLLRRADVAMYVAKRGERGIVVYTAEQDHYSAERLALGGELRRAIDDGELLLHFQPKLDLRDGTLVGVEALVRWQHPQRGFLPPSEFIPLAEQTGLIYPLTPLGARRGSAPAPGLAASRASTCRWPSTCRGARCTTRSCRRWSRSCSPAGTCRPSALVLEITESSLMADPLRAGENLTQLRALGVRVSIDDFGTGYSSLASLQEPVGRRAEDRPVLRAGDGHRRERARHRARDHRPGRRAEAARRRRRSRGPRDAGTCWPASAATWPRATF